MATIPGLKSSFDTISVAEQFVRLSQLASGPAFELQFSITQETVLKRLDKEILDLQQEKNTSGATALLDINVTRLKRDVADIDAYAARTKSNRVTTETTIAAFTDLIALADPSTVAEFDSRLASAIADIEKLDTPVFERFGAPDGLRKLKADAVAQLNALVHNNFATGGDISAVQATLNGLSASFGVTLEITRINEDAGFNLSQNTSEKIADLESDISAIQLGAQIENIDEIEKKKEQFARILTALSLSFEIAQSITAYISQYTVFKQEIDPGSVLNLFA